MVDVIAFIGSPKPNGSTSLLVDAISEGVHRGNGTSEKIYLNDLDFRGCQDCGYCREKETCKLKDDLAPIYEKIRETNAIIIASPIYIQSKNICFPICYFAGTCCCCETEEAGFMGYRKDYTRG